ncbi:MAG: hypothetical protein Q4G67_00715 [Actinomycetia bacterium]|nr:hypothetical protein [Actinomycetes bacterium]
MTTSPDAAAHDPAQQERPTFTDDQLREWGLEEEFFEEAREELASELDQCEERGPVRFSFGDGSYGEIQISDLESGLGRGVEATGDIELPLYTLYMYWQPTHPPVQILRDNPTYAIDFIEIIGGSDEHLRTLAADERLRTVSLQGLVTERDVEKAEKQHALEVEAVRTELASLVESGEITQDEADQQQLPTLSIRAGGSLLTDDGLRSLTGHEKLEDVTLRGGEFSDEALAEVLASLPNLKNVRIDSDTVTGAFLTSLAGRSLDIISVTSKALRAETIAELPAFPETARLDLVGPEVLDGLDIAALKRAFPGLMELWIGAGDGLDDERMFPVFAAFPGIEVNSLTMSRRAVEKAAKKRGVELPADI